jgi:hypothetical protein
MQPTHASAHRLRSVRRFVNVGLVVLALYVLTLDGFIRLATGQQNLIVVRDVILWGTATLALLTVLLSRRPIRVPPLTGLVALFCVLVLVQVVNPAAYSAKVSLVALRQHLEWVPLFFLGFYALSSVKRLRVFAIVLLVAAAANGVVGFVQFSLTPDALAAWGPGYETLARGDQSLDPADRAARTFYDASGRDHVRPPGLGPDAGFGGLVAMLALPAAMALLLSQMTARRRLALACVLPLILVAIVTSQTRSALLASIVAVIAFLIVGFSSQRILPALTVITASAVCLAGAVSFVGGGDGGAFRDLDTIAPRQIATTFGAERGTSLALLPGYASRFPLGAGLGTLGSASQLRAPDNRELSGETNFNYLLLELGIPGLLLAIALLVLVLGKLAGAARAAADRDAGLLLAALTAGLAGLATMWFASSVSATPFAGFFWVAAGVAAYWHPAVRRARKPYRAVMPTSARVPAPG